MKRFFLTLILSVACVAASLAQSATTEFTVNGIKVIYKPTVKNMVSVRVYFRGGVTNYSARQAGIENLALGAIIKCGTMKHSANEFKDIADYYDIGLSNNAELDYSNIEMTCISKYFDKGWDLLAEAINTPIFDNSELQLLKNSITSDIKQEESSPDKHIEQLLLKNAFEGTVYATDPDGTEASINAFTTEQLKEYYTGNMLNKSKMFIVIAGKLNSEDIMAKVKAAFSNIAFKPYREPVLEAPIWTDNRTTVEAQSLSTNYVDGILNAPAMTNPDYIPFRLGVSAFSGTLFSVLRTQHNLSYDPGAYMANTRMPYMVMYVSTTNPSEAINLMVHELNRVKGLTLSNRGVNQIKASFITSNYMKLQSSSAITGNLGIAEIMGGWQYFENIPTLLEQVTPDQITKAMQKYPIGVRWSYLGDMDAEKQCKDAFNMEVK